MGILDTDIRKGFFGGGATLHWLSNMYRIFPESDGAEKTF